MTLSLSGNGITSANIVDGAITNADINASAAIDSSKVSGVNRRNLIINGAMQVAQRGTSFTTDNVYTLDRWYSGDGTGGSPARTLSQESFTAGQTDVPDEPQFYLRHNQTGVSTNGNSSLVQKVESVRHGAGQSVTLSFYAKADSAMTIDARFIQNFGSSGSADATTTEAGISIGTSWAKHIITKTLPSISGKTIAGGDDTLNIYLEFKSTSTFTFDIAQVQLELGSTATDFEHRSYGEELALCKRYYQRWSGVSGEQSPIASVCCKAGGANSTGPLLFKGTMRDTPTMSYSQASDFQVLLGSGTEYRNLTNIGFADIKGTDSCIIMPYIPSTSNNIPGTLRTDSVSAFVAADAEL